MQLVTQISLGLLLFGTLVGDYALLADVGPQAVQRLLEPNQAPEWLVGYSGRGVMVLLVIFVVFPLCMLRRCALISHPCHLAAVGDAEV